MTVGFVLRRAISLVLLAACLGGCFLAPFIQSFKEIGATEGDRQMLLNKQMKEYQNALYWGSAGSMVEVPENFDADFVDKDIGQAEAGEKVVESRISKVKFGEESYSADVDLKVRYYRVPFYVVQERTEALHWEFKVKDGWRLKKRKIG